MINKNSNIEEEKLTQIKSEKSFMIYMMLLSIFTIFLVSFVNWYINVSLFKKYTQNEIKDIKKAYIKKYKNRVKDKVLGVNREIKYHQMMTEIRLKYNLKKQDCNGIRYHQ